MGERVINSDILESSSMVGYDREKRRGERKLRREGKITRGRGGRDPGTTTQHYRQEDKTRSSRNEKQSY